MFNNSIESILNEIFYDDTENTVCDLKKYGLYEITQKKIIFFNDSLNKNYVADLNVVYASFLQSINTKLNSISDEEDKEHLKYILSSIGNYLIDELLGKRIITVKDLSSLKESLKNIYDLLGYDYKDLEKRTQFSRITSILENQQSSGFKNENARVHYEWIGNDIQFDEISRNLKSEKSISSIKDFKKLFSKDPVVVNFNKNSAEFITVLFDTLYEKKYIKPKVKKGHLAPLKYYAVDFDNNILFQKDMKQIKYTIKKNEAKYCKLKAKAENWL